MDTDTIIRQLEYEADKHKNDRLFTGQTDITALCRDLIPKMKELKRYEDLEQDGRLIELPCKVRDTVYAITSPINVFDEETEDTTLQIFECQIKNVTLYHDGSFQFRLYHNGRFVAWYVTGNEFGETIFFSREAAEAALKEMEGRA